MRLPKRGDQSSLLVICLALVADLLFWAFVVWLPLLTLGGFIYGGSIVPVTIFDFVVLPAALGVLAFAGAVWHLASRALLHGDRVVYVLAAFLIAVLGTGNFANGLTFQNYLRGQLIGIAIVLWGTAAVVALMAFGKQSPHAESAS